jgi:hypothetical protein
MAKHQRSHRRRSHPKSRTMRRAQRGGDLAGNPPSSWGWGLGTAGNGWTQFINAMTLQPGQNLATQQGTLLVPVGASNINANNTQGMIGTNLKGGIPQSGGKKRRRKSKRGGSWGAIASQAAVPAVLVALNQSFRKRTKTPFGKSRRRR